MTWEIKDCGNAIKVNVAGRLVSAVAQSFRDDVLGSMRPDGNVLFDLSGMTHVDSSGLGVLVQILQKAQSLGGKVVLAALQPAPKIVFDITKVSRVFEIVAKPEDAIFPGAGGGNGAGPAL